MLLPHSAFSNPMRFFLACGVTATVALLMVAGCVRSKPAAPALSAVELATLAKTKPEFVGNAACVECHKTESESHAHSRHAHTFRAMTPQALGEHAPPEGAIPQTKTALRLADNVYTCVRVGFEDKSLPLQFALGSGKTGITFVGLLDANTLYETRMSYFPNAKTWHITPGQGVLKPGAPGKLAQGEEAKQCLQCHAVTVPATSLEVEPKFYGVGCESCHGAGSVHITAARAGQPKLGMERIAEWTATRVNDLCAKCHRGPAEIKKVKITEGMTARFQPFGLMRSPCFKKSNDTLSCNTCHNPHENASKQTSTYEAACLSCHAKEGERGRRGEEEKSREQSNAPIQNPKFKIQNPKVCPVNPKTGCIPCHMPLRDVFPGQNVPTQMPDHQIGVWR